MGEASEDTCTVTFAEEATVQVIGKLRDELHSALSGSRSVELNLEAVGSADLTLVQLIESARATARHDQKRLALAGPAGGDLRALLERGGFVATPESREFWLHEGLQ